MSKSILLLTELFDYLSLLPDALIHRFEALVKLVREPLRSHVKVHFMGLFVETLGQNVVDFRKKGRELALVGLVYLVAVI